MPAIAHPVRDHCLACQWVVVEGFLYRVLAPDWEPTLPAAGERFGVLDLLAGPA